MKAMRRTVLIILLVMSTACISKYTDNFPQNLLSERENLKGSSIAESKREFFNNDIIGVTIINDTTNAVLDTSDYLRYLMKAGYKFKPRYISFDSIEGIQYISEYNIKTLPFIIFDSNIKGSAFFNRISGQLTKKHDKYILSGKMINPKYIIPGEFQSQKAEIFFKADNFDELKSLIPCIEDFKRREKQIKYSPFYSPKSASTSNVIGDRGLKTSSTDGKYILESTSITQDSDEKRKDFGTDNQYSLQQLDISFVNEKDITYQKDWDETLRQACIIKYFQDKYPDYLKNFISGEMNRPDSFSDNFDLKERDVIKECINKSETEEELKAVLGRIIKLDINDFPAILINNKILITGYNVGYNENFQKLLDLIFEN